MLTGCLILQYGFYFYITGKKNLAVADNFYYSQYGCFIIQFCWLPLVPDNINILKNKLAVIKFIIN